VLQKCYKESDRSRLENRCVVQRAGPTNHGPVVLQRWYKDGARAIMCYALGIAAWSGRLVVPIKGFIVFMVVL
jgi:hypothetical protein